MNGRLEFGRVDAPSVWQGMVATGLFYLALLSQILVAWRFWHLTWDDSAITLGFAQTLAHTGQIEATPGSGIVEGYSTTLWMLLMAGVARIGASPEGLLIAAKLGSLFLNCASIVMLRRWLSTWMPHELATLAAGVFGSSFMFYETINGMETPLLLSELLAMLLLYHSAKGTPRLLYLAFGCLVVLTRWESAWLLVPFAVLQRPFRHAISASAIWFTIFAGSNVWRWWYFGSLLPNTVIAKQSAPYFNSGSHGVLLFHLKQLELIGKIGAPLIIIILIYIFCRGISMQEIMAALHNSPDAKLAVLFVIMNALLTIAIGYNWGPELRSFYPGWPLLIGLILFPLSLGPASNGRSRALLLATAFVSIFSLVRLAHVVQEMRGAAQPVYMPGATVDGVKQTSDVLRRVQIATGKQNDFLYAGPDMGSVMLYSKGMRIIDLGLLCDKTLAQQHYQAIESYVLRDRKPDVIEVHGVWTQLTRLSNLPAFYQNYSALTVDGKRVFLRKDDFQRIPSSRLIMHTYSASKKLTARDPDAEMDLRFKTYYELR